MLDEMARRLSQVKYLRALLADAEAALDAPLDPFYSIRLRRPLPYQNAPGLRIHMVMARLSRHRVVEGKRAFDLILRMAKKWSGNVGCTMRSFSDFDNSIYGFGLQQSCGEHYFVRYFRGEREKIYLPDYAALELEARRERRQFVRLDTRHEAQQRKQYRRLLREEAAAKDVRKVINQLKEVIRDGKQHQDHRGAA